MDTEELPKATSLLAELDYVALLGSETGKYVAAVGKSGLEKGVKAGSIIKAVASGEEEDEGKIVSVLPSV